MASVARELAMALDPATLAGRLGYELDEWQQTLLRSGSRRIIAACGRQVGKSLVLAVAGVHECMFRPGSTVLAVSPSQRQSGELLSKAADLYKRMGRPVPT